MLSNISTSQKITVMIGVMSAILLSALDQTIVSTAMPRIVHELNGLEYLSWVFTAYMLSSTVVIPVYGKLSDIYGRRTLYIVGILIFLIGSILSGLSQSMLQLIIFRAIQGIGGGAIMVNSVTVIGDIFSPAERGKWQGIIGGAFGIASIAGPFLGGWITDSLSWRWIFYVNIPIGIIALAIITSVLPKIKVNKEKVKIDYAGAILLTITLFLLLLGLSMNILELFIAAILTAILFVLSERRSKDPIISLSFFKNKVFSVSVITIFLVSIGMFGGTLYIPLFAQNIIGVTATNSGLILMPMMVSIVIGSAIAGQLISRTGKYKILAIMGIVMAICGMYLLSQMTVQTKETDLIRSMILMGIGLGITMPIFPVAVQSSFDHSKLGTVTAATQLFRSIGGSLGTAILGMIMNNQLSAKLSQLNAGTLVNVKVNDIQKLLSSTKDPTSLNTLKEIFTHSVTHIFALETIIMALALIAVIFLPQIILRKTNQNVENYLEEGALEELPLAALPLTKEK